MEAELNKDVIQIPVADFHSGSNYALFPDRVWHGKNTSHTPRSIQVKIRGQFETFCKEVRQVRKDKKVIVVVTGDAIDGDHHNSGDVCTKNSLEQANIHIEIMNEFQKRIGWKAGDQIHYTRGTQTHVNEYEEYIAEQMGAIPGGEFYVSDLLKLETNGVRSWFIHHGPRKGQGSNEGNPVRSFLRNIYIDALKENDKPPHVVYTGHVHDPIWESMAMRLPGFKFTQMHGVILPSWQAKTAYAWQAAPVSVNRIGGVYHEIKADGLVTIPNFSVMRTD